MTQAYVALGTAIATYAAQNVGAGKVKRIRQGFHAGCMMGCAYAVVTGLIVAFFGKYLTYLFISDDVETIIGYVDIYLKCVATFFIPLVWVNLYRNGIQGTGLWTASHDSRHRRDGGKNGNCGDCLQGTQLYRHLYGKSCGMGVSRHSAVVHVFLRHAPAGKAFCRGVSGRGSRKIKLKQDTTALGTVRSGSVHNCFYFNHPGTGKQRRKVEQIEKIDRSYRSGKNV